MALRCHFLGLDGSIYRDVFFNDAVRHVEKKKKKKKKEAPEIRADATILVIKVKNRDLLNGKSVFSFLLSIVWDLREYSEPKKKKKKKKKSCFDTMSEETLCPIVEKNLSYFVK